MVLPIVLIGGILAIVAAVIGVAVMLWLKPEIVTGVTNNFASPDTASTCQNALVNSNNKFISMLGNFFCKFQNMVFNVLQKFKIDPASFFFWICLIMIIGFIIYMKWETWGKKLLMIFAIIAIIFLIVTFL